MMRYRLWTLSPGFRSNRSPFGLPERASYAMPGMAFNDGGGAPPAPGAPPSPPAEGSTDPARAEQLRRLESDAQAHRSLRGRLRKLDGLRPDTSDQDLEELIALGLKAKNAPKQTESDDEPEPEGDEEKQKRKPTTIGRTEHQAAVARERESRDKHWSEKVKAVEAERDKWKAEVFKHDVDTKLTAICPETVNLKAALAAIRSGEVPFHFEVDEATRELFVLDAAGNDYKTPDGKMPTPAEALASMPKLVPWVATEKLATGAGSGSASVNGTAPSPTRKPAGELTALDKIGLAANVR